MANGSKELNKLSVIGSLSDSQIDRLKELLSHTSVPFVKFQETADEINQSDNLNLSAKDLIEIAKFVRNIEANLGQNVQNETSLRKFLPEFLSYYDGDEAFEIEGLTDETYRNLLKLLPRDLEPISQWYESGILDSVLDIDSFVDVRPLIFNNRIEDLIPIIILRVAVRRDFEGNKSYQFQMTAEELSVFEEQFDKIRKELELIKEKMQNWSYKPISSQSEV